jgi:hypothetical protein
LLSELETYYNVDPEFTNRIVCNERMWLGNFYLVKKKQKTISFIDRKRYLV